MMHFLLVIHVLIAAALIGVVLIQRSDTDGFGLGSGSNANLLSGRSAANLLTRTTAILATLFIINSLALSVLAAHGSKGSIVDTIEQQEGDAAPAPAVELGKDEENGATEIGLDRDKVVDTDTAAQDAAKNEKPASGTVKKHSQQKGESDDAPAVPAAQ